MAQLQGVDVHKNLYKQSGKDVFEIQTTTKKALLVNQQQQRERLILRKRLKVENLDDAESVLSSEEEQTQVEQAIVQLKSSQKVEALTTLHRCFARSSKNAETFIRSEGLPLLKSCLSSSDSSLLHAAAWCAINLSAADSQLVQRAVSLSPLLIQFLQGSDRIMQELCAWAIGNLAGDSQSSKETLLHQGVIPHLLNLVSIPYDTMLEARTQSVLLALINLARDTSFACTRCMLQNAFVKVLKHLLKDVPVSSELCLEVGWLTSCVYSRPETFSEHGEQYRMILHLALEKLSQLCRLEESKWKERVMRPYLVCCGNMIGLSPDVALLASDLPSFLPTITACLACGSQVVTETLWVLANFTAEPSCRVLVVCHNDLMTRLLSLCNEPDIKTVSEVLYLLEAMSRLSSLMSQVLVRQDALVGLSALISHPSPDVSSRALGVVEALLQEIEPQDHPSAVPECLQESLQKIISLSFDNKMVERAKALVKCLS